MKKWFLLGIFSILVFSGCEKRKQPVQIDGSSTVFPITEAVAEEFQKNAKARVTIGVSGTGGGFKKFCRGETDINDASRPIKPVEQKRCKKNGIEYIELPIAYDGISVVTHPKNDWANSMTVGELKKIWEPEAQNKLDKWSDVRDGWPGEEIHLFGAGVDSGTYDYFTKAIVGEEGASRGDFTSSEDDNVLVKGVSTDKLSLGFFGFAYFRENQDKLKAVAIDDGNPDNGKGPVEPSKETISSGKYQPLTRPLFIYIKKSAAKREGVRKFVEFYLQEGGPLVERAGYVDLPKKTYKLVEKRFQSNITGSLFEGEGSSVGVSIQELLKKAGGGSK